MKKIAAFTICLMMLLALAACSGAASEEQMITRSTEKEDDGTEPVYEAPSSMFEAAEEPVVGNYTFFADGTELVPGDPFDPSILPEADSVYEVPSCAIEGADNLYNYGTFELTAFDDGTSEVIYSILLTDPNITTTEGLALGDSVDKVVELYGEGYTQQGSAYIYTGEANVLYIIVQGEHVASIEYRMIME